MISLPSHLSSPQVRYAGHPGPLPIPLPSSADVGGCSGSAGGSGDEDGNGRSGEGFRVLCCIIKFIHRLLHLRISKDSLHAGTIRHTSISISTQEMQLNSLSNKITIYQRNQEMQFPSSSHSTTFRCLVNAQQHEINLMGSKASRFDGCTNDQFNVVMCVHWDNQSDKTSRTTQMRMRTNNSQQEHRVDMHISDDHTTSDRNEKKMKGRRSYIFTMAASSLAGVLFLVPYWEFNCSDATLAIPKIWMDLLPIGYIFLLITVVLVTGHSSQFKDGELPDNAGFKLLQMMQALVLLCLWAGLFTPLHVCRGMSYLVVWTCASGALLMIVISWSIVFHHKTVIKCIKVPYQMVIKCIKVPYQMVIKVIMVPYQMVIKFPKVMYERVQQCLPGLSLRDVYKG